MILRRAVCAIAFGVAVATAFACGDDSTTGTKKNEATCPADNPECKEIATVEAGSQAVVKRRCVECHGKVNEMNVVWHDKSHSMGFCLDCHRQPEQFVRRPENVFDLNSKRVVDAEGLEKAHALIKDWNVKPPQSCSGCHR